MRHVILTHEQADFDALASLLGAHLLDPHSQPVLPRRVNRNGRAFLTLYGSDLPFVDPRDLSAQPIDTVTLVDTQSLTSLKGMGPKTRVHVVDHHPPRPDLPPEWTLRTDETGANTTLFVEALQEQGALLSMVEATLLLLGIYEDTGSLTYTRTTPRDLRAATFLLEHGASLEIAVDFLEHPLSLEQQRLYDRLRANAETHQIHGFTIIVACADAQDMEEEISTIAHKLRDLLDPDGLFLLVTTRGGVQLVARSTSDHIDVGAVAAHFEGGGHPRAAAALIRREADAAPPTQAELEAVRAELLRILPRHVQPALQVAQIMSRGLQVIHPDTPVEEVARRMQRYGYEGYPVVDAGRVVGLITRRAVDRALAHGLKMTAASLMRAGEVTVQPDDSIELLQSRMIDSGWGQVPVVDPQSGEILGIVTRTDLIKTLAPEPRVPGYHNLAERLESALPPARLAALRAVAEAAHRQRAALYIVGGFVRDLLLDRPSLDFDLVVEGDAIALARSLAQQHGGRVTSHARFGTAKWHLAAEREQVARSLMAYYDPTASAPMEGPAAQTLDPNDLPDTLDLVTARTEFYPQPTALPTVERGSIKLDLHRRDFTINTLALRLDGGHYGELQDYWGGLDDLNQGLVRVLHSLSFVDDPTRMLRAVRFEQRFGFQIEERTLDLLREARPLLDRVSGDRLRHELDAILTEPHLAAMLTRLDELGLLTAIHPALTWDDWIRQRVQAMHAQEPEGYWGLPAHWSASERARALAYLLLLIRLPVEQARAVSQRLKLSSQLSRAALEACRVWQALPGLARARPSQVVAQLNRDVPPLALYAAYLAVREGPQAEVLERYVRTWRTVEPTISGHDLRARGLPPGPIYRQILDRLRAAWLDGEIHTPAEEDALLESLLHGHTQS